MINHGSQPDDFDHLLAQWADEGMETSAWCGLLERCSHDIEARRRYFDFVALDVLLADELADDPLPNTESATTEVEGSSSRPCTYHRSPLQGFFLPDPEETSSKHQRLIELFELALSASEPDDGVKKDTRHHSVSAKLNTYLKAIYWRVHPGSFLTVTAALTLLFWIVFYGWIASEQRQTAHNANEAARVEVVASLRVSPNCRWSEKIKPPTDFGRLVAGQQLAINVGLLEVTYGSGARVILEGPANYTVAKRNGGRLDLGRLVAQVPEVAQGFAVQTPTSTVVDLGTEFGVVVDKTRACDVFVYDGTVEVEPLETDGRPSGKKHRLTAGQSLRVGPAGTVEPAAVSNPKQLVRYLSEPITTEAEGSDAYARAVLASKPLAYWRFEETEGDRAVDASGNGNDAEYGEKVWRGLHGVPAARFPGLEKNNRAAGFPGLSRVAGTSSSIVEGERVTASLDQLPDDYSVELWCYNRRPVSERPVTGYFFSRAADESFEGAGGDHCGIAGPYIENGAGRLLYYGGMGRKSGVVGHSVLKTREWYHIAFVRLGEDIRMYLDGNPTADLSGSLKRRLGKGCRWVFVGGRNDKYFGFRGRIDEVALYDRPLTAKEIHQHYAAAVTGEMDLQNEESVENTAHEVNSEE